ncbi:MAG: carbohydrate kinase family protein [bacterium]|nr:carbohydrate kinase family protein [bacterium]
MAKYDIISIGDTTTDAFIKLHDASVHCDLDNKNCQLCMSFADKVPYESLTVIPAVGNSSNVAVGTARLGLKSAAFTAIGGDYFGTQILDVYRKEKVGHEFVKINKDLPTNYHFVLNFQAERTILIKHQHFSYFEPSRIGDAEWIYFSSMAENTLPFHLKLGKYLKAHPKIKMGFNPGTFQLKLGAAKLRDVYQQTYVFFVNREEAQKILNTKDRDIKVLSTGLHKLGPKIVVITDGPDGAYVSDGQEQYQMPLYPDPKPPLERTGAGDAFSTGFMSALVYGLPITEAMCWGPVNSMSVVQDIGAQRGLLTKPQLLKLLNKAPKNYKPKRI